MTDSKVKFLSTLAEYITNHDALQTVDSLAAVAFCFRTFTEQASELIRQRNSISARSMVTICDWLTQKGYVTDETISGYMRIYKLFDLNGVWSSEDLLQYVKSIRALSPSIFSSILQACEESENN